jgi:hypothetical protein
VVTLGGEFPDVATMLEEAQDVVGANPKRAGDSRVRPVGATLGNVSAPLRDPAEIQVGDSGEG